mmetsp:Transcript_1997/g.7712  ORF Transcript_1997/g.7712 Transcript_1997/m.7712 type:complete len:238 (-) Transcript_1997:2404-3117(-)
MPYTLNTYSAMSQVVFLHCAGMCAQSNQASLHAYSIVSPTDAASEPRSNVQALPGLQAAHLGFEAMAATTPSKLATAPPKLAKAAASVTWPPKCATTRATNFAVRVAFPCECTSLKPGSVSGTSAAPGEQAAEAVAVALLMQTQAAAFRSETMSYIDDGGSAANAASCAKSTTTPPTCSSMTRRVKIVSSDESFSCRIAWNPSSVSGVVEGSFVTMQGDVDTSVEPEVARAKISAPL